MDGSNEYSSGKDSSKSGGSASAPGIGATSGSNPEIMKAPGRDSAYISREEFEKNPGVYFRELHKDKKWKSSMETSLEKIILRG
ncbi:hypothetical protein Ancab_020920, partial [Ancistrocladus abbreviatus]